MTLWFDALLQVKVLGSSGSLLVCTADSDTDVWCPVLQVEFLWSSWSFSVLQLTMTLRFVTLLLVDFLGSS